MFSKIFYDQYDSKDALLREPEKLATDGHIAFSSGLWNYMTPESPKPSIHDVMTGFFVPNSSD